MRLFAVCLLLAFSTLVASAGGYRVRERRGRGGFEVVSADGSRVLARVPRGRVDEAMANPTFRWLMHCYGQMPSRLPAMLRVQAGEPDEVKPLLTDLWHQFAPYNAQSPLVDGQPCATGCVAHAMAQVMRYHRYARGGKSFSYTDSLGCGQTLAAHFPLGGYDWELMRDEYLPGGYAQAELDALAQLLADCGVAVEMRYGVESSAAFSELQPRALVDFFGYDRGVEMLYRDFYSYSEWTALLRRELAQGRPVLMTAQSASLSHAFCCDGYDAEGLFHLNLGMAGDADGYYYLPHLTPQQPEWYDPQNPEGGMNLMQQATIGIQPPGPGGAMQPERHALAMEGIAAVRPHGRRSDTLAVALHHVANVGWNAHRGQVALALLHRQDTLLVAPVEGDFAIPQPTDATCSDTLSFVLPSSIAPGLHRMVPLYRQPSGQWHEVRTSVGTPNHLLARVADDSLFLLPDTAHTARLTLHSFDFPDTIERGTWPPFRIDLACQGAEFCGRFYVVLTPCDAPHELRIIQMQGLTLLPGELTSRTFERTWVGVKSGAYHLRLAYDQTLFADSLTWLAPEILKEVQVVEPATGVSAVGRDAAPAARFTTSGLALPPQQRHHGLEIRRQDGHTRKVMRR